jgi:hypothetical protein
LKFASAKTLPEVIPVTKAVNKLKRSFPMPNLEENLEANDNVVRLRQRQPRFTFLMETLSAQNKLRLRLGIAQDVLNKDCNGKLHQCSINDPHFKLSRNIAKLEEALDELREKASFEDAEQTLKVADERVFPLARELEIRLQESYLMTIAPETEALMKVLRTYALIWEKTISPLSDRFVHKTIVIRTHR